MRVLVVEDEERLAAGARAGLEAEGFAVDVAVDGPEGLWRAREGSYDVIVLDLMLPGMSGFRVCAALREEGVWVPILVLTAKDGEWDEVEALDTGRTTSSPSRSRTRCWWPASGRCCAASRSGGRARSWPATCGDAALGGARAEVRLPARP